MLKSISREEIFKNSLPADLIIADQQAYFAKDFDPDEPDEAQLLANEYDHRQPFHSDKLTENQLFVLAVPAESREEYEESLPRNLSLFFEKLGIQSLFLMDWLKRDWKDFPFENEAKKKQFLEHFSATDFSSGLKLSAEKLSELLPLLLFSNRYGQEVFYLFPENTSSLLSLFLCEDGNLHISIEKKERERLQKTAEACGFVFGEFMLCSFYHNKKWG